MKILTPIEFNGYVEQGGSTMPWRMRLLDNGIQNEYIVKLFSEKNINQQHAVAKEIIGSYLAKQFGLFTPDFALVHFDAFFIESILSEKERVALLNKHGGLKFASKYQEGMAIFSPAKHKRFLNIFDIANIFTFDCLIYNLDRGFRPDKPNLLVEDDNYLLIDHELCLPFIDNEEGLYNIIMDKFSNSQLDYPYARHLLFPILKSYHHKDKEEIFVEFEDYLRNLNINRVQELLSQMNELNISTGHELRLIKYLRYLKDNSHLFCQILLKCIV